MQNATSDPGPSVHEVPVDPKVAEQIRQALEIMARVRTAQAALAERNPPEMNGNTYVLPELPVFHVSASIERN